MRLLELWRAWREMRRYDALSAGSLEGDRVKVTGIVDVLDETLIAPLSGRECVFFRSRIRGTSPGQGELRQTRPFVLRGADATAVVVDGSAFLFGAAAVKLGERDTERKLTFAARFAIKMPGQAWFEEVVISPGDFITVGGVLMHDLDPEPPRSERTFREHPAPRLRLVGSNDHPLVIAAAR
jgi:hypothetical protein